MKTSEMLKYWNSLPCFWKKNKYSYCRCRHDILFTSALSTYHHHAAWRPAYHTHSSSDLNGHRWLRLRASAHLLNKKPHPSGQTRKKQLRCCGQGGGRSKAGQGSRMFWALQPILRVRGKCLSSASDSHRFSSVLPSYARTPVVKMTVKVQLDNWFV